jgi:hypothetical protein
MNFPNSLNELAIVERWVLATSPKEAQKMSERIYPAFTFVSVSNPVVPNPTERYWWHFRRWTRPDAKRRAQRD